jgi:hypothetical protein
MNKLLEITFYAVAYAGLAYAIFYGLCQLVFPILALLSMICEWRRKRRGKASDE